MENSANLTALGGGVQLRWLNVNCYELKLPGGKTVVTDPFLPHETDVLPLWRDNACGYTVANLEGADYTIIGHSHGDHLGSIDELFDRFGKPILCHSAYAIYMTKAFHIPQQMIFPIEGEQHYEFADFTLDTATARHPFGGPKNDAGEPVRLQAIRCSSKGTPFEPVSVYGGMYNTDFILTTRSNLRVAFCSGDFPDHQRRAWKDRGINLLLRQCDQYLRDDRPEALVQDILDTQAELCLPLHWERYYGTEQSRVFADQVNQALRERKCPACFFLPQRGKWYRLDLSLAEA